MCVLLNQSSKLNLGLPSSKFMVSRMKNTIYSEKSMRQMVMSREINTKTVQKHRKFREKRVISKSGLVKVRTSEKPMSVNLCFT